MTMLPGHDSGTRWAADGIAAEGILKDCSACREPVDIGSRSHFGEVTAISRDGAKGMVVRKEKEDVWLFGCSQRGTGKGQKGKEFHDVYKKVHMAMAKHQVALEGFKRCFF